MDLRGSVEDDQTDLLHVFNILQKRPNTSVYLKVDQAMKARKRK